MTTVSATNLQMPEERSLISRLAIRFSAQSRVEGLLFALVLVILLISVVLPLGMLALRSFQSEELTAFTLANYIEIVDNPRLLHGIVNSLLIAAGTTILSVFLGVALAWVNYRTNTPGTSIFSSLNLIPFFTPSFIGAIAWTLLASQNQGLLNKAVIALGASGPIFNIYSPTGIIWVLSLFEAPLVYLFVSSAFRRMDPSLEEAARISGAGLFQTAATVTLPMALPSILAAALLIFVTVLGSFEVPLVLGIPARFNVLTTELYAMTSEYPVRYNMAAAMCVMLIVAAGLLLLIQRKLILSRDFITMTGKAYKPSRVDIGRGKYLGLAFNLVFVLSAVILPIFALLVTSLSPIWTGVIRPQTFTLANYLYVLTDFDVMRRGLKNTILLAIVGATLGTILGTISAYLVFRSKMPGRVFLDVLSGISLAVPGAILAVGVAIFWLGTPVYGTLFILLLAFVARFTPYAQRSVASSLIAVSGEFDECSRVAGATWWGTVYNIVLPLIKPGVVAAWLLLFIMIVRELGMSLFLYKTGTETTSVAIYLLMIGRPSATAAACIIQVVIVLSIVMILRATSRKDELML
ncbi:ABC transporter permease [Microvirga zambiensis]|uniref:ABC transporter permease n=1 Tax=Microvirga zambiensis TaxID=1402137 RepID=UPI00191EF622|nr:iron ABC transporter permease [Microvirga zambiensis]